jgi:formylglycine-generating enzyme required for sulfatase activity
MTKYLLCACIAVAFTLQLYSQQKGMQTLGVMPSDARVALVIGNGAYQASPLKNPTNDAQAVTQALKNTGFTVYSYSDLNQKEMKRVINEFGKHIPPGSTALFFYSGHGMQINGLNYLIPIGALIEKEQDVDIEGARADQVLGEMEAARSRLNIVVLDACRDNPYQRSFRSISRGLATMNAPAGTIVAFSTSPGNVAMDGTGSLGAYTEEFVRNIQTPGLRIEDVFKQTRGAVREKTGGRQIPWESSSIEGEFYFAQSGSTVVAPPPTIKKTETKKNDGFSLDDIDKELEAKKAEADHIASERKAEADRIAAEREEKLQTMRAAFEKVMALQKENIALDKKKIARERFLQYFAADLDWTNEDEQMRSEVQNYGEVKWIFVEGGPTGDFYISITEVTFEQYDMFCDATGYKKPKADFGREKQPVINVNVADAIAYCAWLSKQTGTTIRLPKENEWEFAARGGKKSKGYTYSGSSKANDVAWYEDNSGTKTHEVGTKKPNELGIYDMSGNVWEWCDTTGAVRGGSWFDLIKLNCQVSSRFDYDPSYRNLNYGFRLLQKK